ncbi:Hsp20/alpha crystallin family protein [Halosegnis rubeus]|uniref:Hsp20 family protein n=1 Tax=Halosegnis rubeus TaxID=2212850 RepID=A0A5N5UJ87_9EURY|nr:Hsp20/alpha crystallin family protein [Halosegnis rubeus]KAB7518756.1 Hsp20 family protein [Halosegnis rubeus]
MSTRRSSFDIFSEMEELMERMRQSMAESVGDVRSWRPQQSAADRHGLLALEADGEDYRIVADLPGFETEDIDLRFDDGRLTLTATNEVETNDEHGAHSRSRHVSESLYVPGTIDADGIKASYQNGVLDIHLPIDDPVDSHRIDVD